MKKKLLNIFKFKIYFIKSNTVKSVKKILYFQVKLALFFPSMQPF